MTSLPGASGTKQSLLCSLQKLRQSGFTPPFLFLQSGSLPVEEEWEWNCPASVIMAEPGGQSCAPPWRNTWGRCPSGFMLHMTLPGFSQYHTTAPAPHPVNKRIRKHCRHSNSSFTIIPVDAASYNQAVKSHAHSALCFRKGNC